MSGPATAPGVGLDDLRLRVAAGVPPRRRGERLPRRCDRAVRLAERLGAPLLAAVDAAIAAEGDRQRANRAVTVASAQARTVAIGLAAAPVVLVPGVARLVGVDLLAFYASGAGRVVLAVASALIAAGVGLIVWLVRRVATRAASAPTGRRSGRALAAATLGGVLAWQVAGPVLVPLTAWLASRLLGARRPMPRGAAGFDEAVDLVATAMSAGAPPSAALRAAADELPAWGPDLRRLAIGLELGAAGPMHDGPRVSPGLARLEAAVATAQDVGAPVVGVLRRLASDVRADHLAAVLAAAERLPAQLTVPTTLFLLPATVLLIGAPVAQAGLDIVAG